MKRAFALTLLLACVVWAGVSGQSTLAGNWQGVIAVGPSPTRVGLVLTEAPGGYSAVLVIIDQENARVPVQKATVTGNAIHLDIPNARGTYDGTVNAAGTEMTGTFTQASPIALNFKRVDKLDPPPGFGEQEKADVAAAIDAYFRAFTAKDFEAFRAVLQAPFTRWPAGGTPNISPTLDDVVMGYQQARQNLEGTEYAVSRAAEMIITPLSSTAAHVDVHWRRDKKDGSLFQEGAEILTVVKTAAGWKINGNLGRSLSQYRKVF